VDRKSRTIVKVEQRGNVNPLGRESSDRRGAGIRGSGWGVRENLLEEEKGYARRGTERDEEKLHRLRWNRHEQKRRWQWKMRNAGWQRGTTWQSVRLGSVSNVKRRQAWRKERMAKRKTPRRRTAGVGRRGKYTGETGRELEREESEADIKVRRAVLFGIRMSCVTGCRATGVNSALCDTPVDCACPWSSNPRKLTMERSSTRYR
jgi:hypothetical protein